MQSTIDTIAKLYVRVETLKPRNRDSLDFHSIFVGELNDALTAAYLAGYASAARAAAGNREDSLPTEVHAIRGKIWLHEGPAEPEDGKHAETVITVPVPEVALLRNRWREETACNTLIPQAILHRRIK